jgi:uncharacterized protein YqjF (DUF2071 family)
VCDATRRLERRGNTSAVASAPATEALAAVRRQRASLARTAHRPFALPSGPWITGQSSVDLLFAHWAVPQSALRAAVPARIPIDTFEGFAWIGMTPFEVVGAHPRTVPPLPWLSRFPELNVRTYTTIDGRPGIWFFNLDAARAAGEVRAGGLGQGSRGRSG